MSSQLTPEDQARVDSVVNSGGHEVARKPFRPGMLLLFIVLVLTGLSGLSYYIAWSHGVV